MFPLYVASVQQSFISSLFVEVMVSSSWHLAIIVLVFWNAGESCEVFLLKMTDD